MEMNKTLSKSWPVLQEELSKITEYNFITNENFDTQKGSKSNFWRASKKKVTSLKKKICNAKKSFRNIFAKENSARKAKFYFELEMQSNASSEE
jgi:hypothetical protein